MALKNVKVPFNLPHVGREELANIMEAHKRTQLSGDGYFTKACNLWIERKLNARKVLLTHSCTAALEMMAILSGVGKGDEIIMPSFTFVSTANAFVLRGATPVFIDIRADTLNINEDLIEAAITKKTKAIVTVHYAGITCEIDKINRIARKHKLLVFEDAAQAFLGTYKNKYSGTLGDLGAFSFHETKNVISGEGGALVINNSKFIERAEIIREKGTDRSKFLKGLIDKYTWVDLGSSYLPGELIAAFLFAQLKRSERINKKRLRIWQFYHRNLKVLEDKGFIKLPCVPQDIKHNGHLFYIITKNQSVKSRLMGYLKTKGINTVFHYIPLHTSPAGRKFAKARGRLRVTNATAKRLIRLPLFYDMRILHARKVVREINNFYKHS